MITPEEFWSRLEDIELVSSGKLHAIRKKIETKPAVAANTLKIARVLVSNKILTHDLAKDMLVADWQPGVESTPTSEPDTELAGDIGFEVDDAPSMTERSAGTRQKGLPLLPIGLGVAAVLLIAVALIPFLLQPSSNAPTPTNDDKTSKPSTPIATESISEDEDTRFVLVDSDKALWGRPNSGVPISFPVIPVGTQMIVRAKLGELASAAEGQKLLKSIGPEANALLTSWADRMGVAQSDFETLTLYLLPQGTTLPEVVVEGTLKSKAASDALSQHGEPNGQNIVKLASNAVWRPADREKTFYFGKQKTIDELALNSASGVDSSRNLRREMRLLLQQTHETDSLSVLANPNFLSDEAQGLFPDTRRRLLDGLFQFWSDESQAVSLGFQTADVAFLEVRMVPREDLRPRILTARIQEYVQSLPTQASDFLGRAELDPFWQPLAMRFPAMLTFVSEQTRVLSEGNQVALTAIAPVEATHNLLLATELSLATRLRASVTTEMSAKTLDELLATKTSVRFSQKSLDQAMKDVAQQLRDEFNTTIEIKIVGSDLEPEGITRNQQIRNFAANQETVAAILTQLVLKANPDQAVTEATDPNLKLVWLRPVDEPNTILISTRAAASTKGIALPKSFMQ